MNDKPYISFSLEDFLTDDFFISSVGNPTHESVSFWNDYINSHPQNITEYYAAKKYILSSGEVQPLITDDEVAQLWAGISLETGIEVLSGRKRRRVFAWSAALAAACIAAAVLVWISPFDRGRSRIYDYAVSTADSIDRTEARLVISDNNTVVINEKNALITYHKETITVSEQEIAKNESASYNQLIIPNGKMSKLTLADGTTVWVNANTRVVYPIEFVGKKREIYVDGEVFLDVVRDKRPFIVKTRRMDIEVLGTRFNVRSFDDRELQQVVLVDGSVEIVSDGGKSRSVLEPSQMFEASGGTSHIARVDVRRYASWIEGLYFFEREPLSAVAQRLSEHYAVNIVCSEKAGKFLCSGKLDIKDNLDEVLHVLCRTMPLACENVEEGIYVIGLKDK